MTIAFKMEGELVKLLINGPDIAGYASFGGTCNNGYVISHSRKISRTRMMQGMKKFVFCTQHKENRSNKANFSKNYVFRNKPGNFVTLCNYLYPGKINV